MFSVHGPLMEDDLQIIDAVRAGDSAKYDLLVVRYQHRLQGLLWHACGDRQLSEDISQEAFFRAYRKLHLYSAQSQFFTWLARIGLNLLASLKRKRSIENQMKREGMEQVMETLGQQGSPSDQLSANERRQGIQQAIALMDHDRRIILLLRDFDDMDYESISQVMAIPVGTVRSRLHRARLELREIIQSRFAHLAHGEAQ